MSLIQRLFNSLSPALEFGNVVLDIPLRHSSHARPQRHVCRNPGPSRIQASAWSVETPGRPGRPPACRVRACPPCPLLTAGCACCLCVWRASAALLTADCPLPTAAGVAHASTLPPTWRARAESTTSRTSASCATRTSSIRRTSPVSRADLTAPSHLLLRRARALRLN